MGLDITAYERVVWNRACTPDEDVDYDYDTQTHIYFSPHFEDRALPLKEGIYDIEGESMGFRAGSYSGYNWWRSKLAELVGTTDQDIWGGKEPVAFGELINFSDCEGTIGPEVSRKLAKDFEDWSDRAEAFAKDALKSFDGEYWLQRYNEWKNAFKLASGEGAVQFH